jgi:transcriptional regulator with XRE-family HTH domain
MTPEQNKQNLLRFTREQVVASGLTQTEIARRMKRTRTALRKLMDGTRKCGGTVLLLCEVLDVFDLKLTAVPKARGR